MLWLLMPSVLSSLVEAARCPAALACEIEPIRDAAGELPRYGVVSR